MRLIFTVDVELDLGNGPSSYGIDRGLPFILSILKEYNVKGTFFINGLAINRLKEGKFIERILNEGHEIASHGYRHTDYRKLPANVTAKELLQIRKILESISGKKIKGFRAPQFRINTSLMKILKEVGYIYDSSVPEPKCISAASLLRGVKNTQYLINSKLITEFPVTCLSKVSIPHGLLWLSKIGFSIYKRSFNYLKKEKKNVIFYVHPFDLVSTEAVGKNLLKGLLRNLFYRANLENPKKLLEKLLCFWKENDAKFTTFENLLQEIKK